MSAELTLVWRSRSTSQRTWGGGGRNRVVSGLTDSEAFVPPPSPLVGFPRYDLNSSRNGAGGWFSQKLGLIFTRVDIKQSKAPHPVIHAYMAQCRQFKAASTPDRSLRNATPTQRHRIPSLQGTKTRMHAPPIALTGGRKTEVLSCRTAILSGE